MSLHLNAKWCLFIRNCVKSYDSHWCQGKKESDPIRFHPIRSDIIFLDILKIPDVLHFLLPTFFNLHYVNKTRETFIWFVMQCKFDMVFIMHVIVKLLYYNPFPFSFLMVQSIALFWDFHLQPLYTSKN